MTRSALLAAVLLSAGCTFAPDLSRFPECGPEGACPEGSSCLTEVARCVPDCGEACPVDAGETDAGEDAGTAGVDAGADAGAPGDAGADDGGARDGGDAGPVPLRLDVPALPPAVETQPWSFRFVPTGGVPPYAFSLDGGAPGFTLDVAGTLAAVAAPQPGAFPLTVTVRDDDTPRATVHVDLTLEVRPFLRVASRPPLVQGRQGQAYSLSLAATGGQPPYTWTRDGGTLPNGLTLSPTGILSGTPSNTGTYTFGVAITDDATPPQQALRSLTVDVRAIDTLLSIATTAAADGRVGTPYEQPLRAYGGTQPYAWTLASGALPPGITIVDSGTQGRLGGTPTQAGTYTFTVRCADTLTNQTQALSIVVY
jgi:hypothetical protein